MSLLSQASLVVTPNGYKEGKLYSVIPSDGSGDFTFTRATTATRVNSDGLVELVPYNLVQYSEQFDNAAWNKSQGFGGILPIVTANYGISPDGTQNADRIQLTRTTATNSFSYVFQVFTATTGKPYTWSVWLKSLSGTPSVALTYNGTQYSNIVTLTNEWERYEFTTNASATACQVVFILFENLPSTSLTADFLAYGFQAVEGTNALPYQKTETRLNIPRLDYSLGGCPNILLEPQRTNLTTYSEQFDDASWNKINSSVTANADISPDGYTNADRIYDNATSGQHRVGKNISVVSATTYTFSVFAKKGSLRYCYLFTVAGGASDRYYFDLQDGVSITAGGKIEDYGSGWYRISAQVTAAATGNELFAFNLTNSPSSPSYSGTGTGYHMIYGYQVEAGNYQTSYIPTQAASVTRNAEVISLTNLQSNGILGATGLTYFMEFSKKNLPGAAAYPRIGNLSGNDVIGISTNSTQLLSSVRVAGGGFLNTPILSPYNNEMVKVAFSLNGATLKVFVNGALVQTATASLSSIYDKLDAATSLDKEQKYKSIVLWKTPLTDDECIQLTTI